MWPSMRSWTNTVDHLLDDPLAAKIRSSSNVEAIFSTLKTDNNMKSIKDNPELLPIVLRNILFKHLVYIEGTHPYKVWMLDDIPRLVSQMKQNPNEFLEVWKPLQENPTFQQVMELVPDALNSSSLNANGAIEICALLKIYYTSTPNTSIVPLMRKSLNVAQKYLSQAPYDIIMLFPTAGLFIERDFQLVRLVFRRIKRDLQVDVTKATDTATMIALMELCTVLRHYFSPELFRSFVDRCTEIYSLKVLSKDAERLLLTAATTMSKMYEMKSCPTESKIGIERCLVHFTRLLSESKTELSPYDLHDIQRATHKVRNRLKILFVNTRYSLSIPLLFIELLCLK